MNNTPACNPRIYIRSRCPRLTLAFWTFALIVWFCSLFSGAVPAKAASSPDTAPASLPDLFCIIVDRSGSMGPGSGNNNLVGPASEKLRDFIAGLPQGTTVRMVFFDSTMGTPRRWNELTPDTRKDIGSWIGSEFRPAGQTRLFDTVGSVLEEALAEKDKFNRIGLLVFSDGEDNKSERFRSWAEIERLSAELVSEHPASFLRLYSLGHAPGVAPGAPWKTEVAPDAADLRKINLEPPPEARFRIIPESAEIGQKVVFVVLPGPGRIESATWVFGDGSSGNGTATEHTFAKAGVFGGSLTVTGSSGTETKPFSMTVADRVPLRAAFAWLPKAARIGDTIEFIDESAGIPTESHWFIDGNPVGTGRTFSWPSDRAGNVSVRVEIKRGDETAEVTHNVPVMPPKLDAGFAIAPGHSVSIGTSVVARSSTAAADILHEWYAAGVKIGDHADLTWTPLQAGLIEIRHRVTRGGDVTDSTDRIQVLAQPPPAGFTVAQGLEIDLGQTITATATRSDPAWRHSWRLSTGETFVEPVLTWQPKQPGRVEIIHAVESPGGHAESRETLVVRDKVSAEFTVSSSAGRTPMTVEFTPLNKPGIVSFLWAFGDGETASEPEPHHSYRAAGEYRPRLTVRDVAGREHTYELSKAIVAVAPRPNWIAWAIGGGAIVALALGGALFIWDRQRPVDLSGRLEWRFGGQLGRVELSGRKLELNALEVPAWKPTGTYTLICRKADGYQLLRDGVLDQPIEQDTCLEAEGIRFRLTP